MDTVLAYDHNSSIRTQNGRCLIQLAPNLERDAVFLTSTISDPLLFRDSLLALKDCIDSSLYISLDEIRMRQLDPLITVTRDTVYLEAFSQDESSYARIAMGSSLFCDLSPRSTGCTNVEFSDNLRDGLLKMKRSANSELQVHRKGIGLKQDRKTIRQRKIKLPPAWIQGFLQIQAAMRHPSISFQMDPADLRNLIVYLKARKEKSSPRSLRFFLFAGKSVRVIIEPWNDEIELNGSEYAGTDNHEIRIWGRRRLLLLEKLLPCMDSVDVMLQGTGRPSFWICRCPDLTFLLGMTAWIERDWTRRKTPGRLKPSTAPSPEVVEQIHAYLRNNQSAFMKELIRHTGHSLTAIENALDVLCLQGHILYDPVSRWIHRRDLFQFSNEQ